VVIVGGIAVVAVEAIILVVVLILPEALNTKDLDVAKAQEGVAQILADPVNGYGAQRVSDVQCNNGKNPVAAKDRSFTCEANVDGTHRQITAVFVDDKGTYEVDWPRLSTG
jgi:hypothetical protein